MSEVVSYHWSPILGELGAALLVIKRMPPWKTLPLPSKNVVARTVENTGSLTVLKVID
jgi:hypothetical protein